MPNDLLLLTGETHFYNENAHLTFINRENNGRTVSMPISTLYDLIFSKYDKNAPSERVWINGNFEPVMFEEKEDKTFHESINKMRVEKVMLNGNLNGYPDAIKT